MAGRTLSRYAVQKAIGKGSYGEVFLVTHREDGKQYVMKNIKLTASSEKERLAAEQEASLLSQLKHPNIVSYKESFQDANRVLHIVMGYCEGGDLCTRLKSFHGQLLPEARIVEWFVQIALALQYLHDKNILHRDLKTQNIFLSRNDIIKVGDLGIARVLDGSCDLASTVIGTPYYMSPELFSNQPYNHKSDIWALGCCVYEMATLKHAFSARNINALMFKIVQGKVPALPHQFSPDLTAIVHKMLARDAQQRPSVHQLLRMEYIRRHIKMFLDRANNRKRKKKGQGSSKIPVEEADTGEHSPDISYKPPRPTLATPAITSNQNRKPQAKPLQSGMTPTPLSSARERRRKHRQEAGQRARVVLRSRSSSDPQLRPSSSSSNSSTPSPSPPLSQGDETDGATQVRTTGAVSTVGLNQSGEDGCSSEGRREDIGCVGRRNSGTRVVDEECGDEVEEFFSLLDCTLHLPEPPADTEQAPPTGLHPTPNGLPPGRLQERIMALRRECELELGPALLTSALSTLDHLDPEADPDMLVLLSVLGKERHQNFAAKLRQLKLCEEALADV